MNVKLEIHFDQLKEMISQLSSKDLNSLKNEIDSIAAKRLVANKNNLKHLLLNGPTLDDEAIKSIEDARKR
jgi:hypothetical protein